MTSHEPNSPAPDATAQMAFWRGDFGREYALRNEITPERLQTHTRAWARMLNVLTGSMPSTILEVGANVGINLHALRQITSAPLYAVEPNSLCRQRLAADGIVAAERVLDGTARAIALPDASVDLVFTCGVMIHIHPDHLPASCQEMYRVSRRYILCAEYFSDKPETIPYRNQQDLLFKRDFGALWMEQFPQLRLLDYGFFWKQVTDLDNLTWWLFEKG
ncbi:MAG: methyltransferase domain-containing protein [Magnetococcales bacterium]|nr:methyltransferase domain-containing protein [Magnetococcales bacterium]